MQLMIEVSPGELIDKLTILEIKLREISDKGKLANVKLEYDLLAQALDAEVAPTASLAALQAELKAVNEALWKIEDDIREQERRQDFGPEFIRLARAVYRTNDVRARLKRQINELLNSSIVEEKAYASY
jgi:hypothetical protein